MSNIVADADSQETSVEENVEISNIEDSTITDSTEENVVETQEASEETPAAVSYTHLTLPTTPYV